MKTKTKHILSFLSAILLMFALIGTDTPIFAAEPGQPFQPMDGYILAYGQSNSEAPKTYAYYSPFVPKLTYDEQEVDGYSILFGLKNTSTGETLEIAYCTDMPVDAVSSNYRPLNLNDSTYATQYADKLRAIVLGSYPHVQLDALIKNSGINNLSMFEAITGTQLAIWKTAHGDTVKIVDFCYKVTSQSYANSGSGHTDLATAEYNAYNNGDDDYKAAVKSRIEQLYNYLMALPERTATSTVISEAAFLTHEKPAVNANTDGTYDITVSTKVNIPEQSNLKLTAYVDGGNYYTTVDITGSGEKEYTLTIENVPASAANGTVTLSLDGTQTISEDVFLLDAEGIRGTSQSMIAPLTGKINVHAEVKGEPDRVLTIYKTEKIDDKKTPLEGISFEVYYVGSVDDFRDGKLDIGTTPTEDDIKTYAKPTNLVGTITTGSDGYGSLNLSTADGVYLVRELPNDLVTSSVAFFVSLPDYSRLDENGNPSYTITAEPKNTTKDEKVEIEKDVTNLDNEHDTFDIGTHHTWIIQSSIPSGIASGKKYEVSDTLDTRLTLVSIDRVALAKDNGTFGDSEDTAYRADDDETPLYEENLVLTEGTDYTLVQTKTDSGNDAFTVSLTPAGMKKIADAIGTDTENTYELRIYFTAYINETAGMGEEIPNDASVEYINKLNKTYTAESDQPEVHTGGTQFVKVDSTDSTKTLAGATFKVYREATEDDLKNNIAYEEFSFGDQKLKLIFVEFYATSTPAKAESKVTSVTTTSDGVVYVYGLAYGTYYLVETQAPAGYNTLREPIKFEIAKDSHLDTAVTKIANTSGMQLPETGGIGTTLFTTGGLLLITAAAGLFLIRRRYV